MTGHFRFVLAMGVAGATCLAVVGSAQGTTTSVTQRNVSDRAARREAALLARTVSLRLDRVPLHEALDTLASRARLQLVYDWQEVPVNRVVSLVADKVTVRDALSVLLQDTGVEPVVSESGRVRLRPKDDTPTSETAMRQGGGTIAGRVTDETLKSPLSQVAVRVDGTTLTAVSKADGRFAIVGVTPGGHRVTARRVGYQPSTKDITVAADQQVVLALTLVAAPTKLDEVVTTAVGQQRRYEVGNVISTINADSIVPTAPITSLTDLISARAPGVEVMETSGMAGAGETIRIRGLSSLVLQNDPILIVDGVRQDNGAGGDGESLFEAGGPSHPNPTRLNDLNFADIATVEVLKGPSASTEYGTDAAHGVIVITTKRGQSGAPRWAASAEQTVSKLPVRFPQGYFSWGHTTDGSHTAVNCPLIQLGAGVGGFSGFYGSTQGTCAVDSVTTWNPLNNSATTIFGTGHRAKYDLQVSGGSDAVRYFVSGGLSNETGLVHMPTIFRAVADTAHVGLPGAALNPNAEDQRSIRLNTAIRLSSTTELTATGSFVSTYQQTPDASLLYLGAQIGRALPDAAHYYGYDEGGVSFGTPLGELSTIGSQHTRRVVGGMTGTWHPSPWLAGYATVGLDHGSQQHTNVSYPLANPLYESYGSYLELAEATTDVYSVDLRGTATADVSGMFQAVTSLGLQTVDTRTAGQTAAAGGITPTNLTLNGATGVRVTQLGNRQATLGGYGEEELRIASRLFLTGALRVDAASGFGKQYATASYPKASLSWLALNGGTTTLRVRGAFGESGVQPANGEALLLYQPTTAYAGATTVSVSTISSPGNPTLRPERSQEFEGGVDVDGWRNRISAEVTAYVKTTRDALVDVSVGGDVCCYAYQENIGEVRNEGLEGSAAVAIVQGRWLDWEMSINASANRNKLISLAPGVSAQVAYNNGITTRQEPGYPLYGLWGRRLSYRDANGDGIIVPNEVALADSASFLGSSTPTRELSAATHVGLWRGAVRVGALADYRGGYRVFNAVASVADEIAFNTRATNDPTAPLWLQGRAAAQAGDLVTSSSYAEDGTFFRLRELSLTYTPPPQLLRRLRLHSLAVTGAVRNLALWTRYSGPDPEVSNSRGGNVQVNPIVTSGSYVVNNDVRVDGGAVPLARYWVLRLSVGP